MFKAMKACTSKCFYHTNSKIINTPLLASLCNPSEDNNCNFAKCIAKTQTLSNIPLLASLVNPSEYNNCNFARGSLTELFKINLFKQLK